VHNFYQLLSVAPTATPEEIKRAFRSEIARYHPDKVQHLGQEFQDMAASRAAALTEAYRTLMNAELRAEYDRTVGGNVLAASAPANGAAPPAPPKPHHAHNEPAPQAPGTGDHARSARFASERRDRDDFVRKATLDRFRQALSAEIGNVEELPARGFDLDFASKAKKLFSRNDAQRYAVKVVPHVDKLAVQDVWNAAQKGSTPICIFLMGNRVAPVKELSDTITEMRKKSRTTASISVIPVDLRDWSAHVPSDAPASCRNLLKRLRDASV
jgi:curved DNA-binding protein CbpA